MPLPFPTNPSLLTLPVYQPGRPIQEVARELGLSPDGILKMASNENTLGPSPLAVKAMRKALGATHLYPDGNAFYLKAKLAAKLGLTPGHLIFGNGSNEILELIGHTLLWEKDAEVVASQYCFAVYPIVAALFGVRLVLVPAKNYAHDLDAMLAAITPETRVVFVANPNNPTGTAASAEAISRFVAAVPERVLIALDEAYIEFLDDAQDLLPELLEGRRPNLILMRTFSKIYGLAGLRVGYGMGHPDFIAELEKTRQPFNVNALAQAAALAALDDHRHVERTRRLTVSGRAFFKRAFRRLGLESIESHANFVLVRVGDGQRVFQELQKLGIIIRPMASYQLPEFVRISIGRAAENKRCLDALQKILGR
ncbi:MAG: histidinol-phosphate transaminase [Verrucomicrobia bacterium]|nr:MAG: histidinol-phosphate transaminase [Verrucomicrobiota bacterium]